MTRLRQQSHPTRFNMTSPCDNCPFRRDVEGYLIPSRAGDIADAILHEQTTFTCHKTPSWHGDDELIEVEELSEEDDDWEDESSSGAITEQSEHCAGALIFSKKHEGDIHCANAILQIAERLGMYDSSKLKEEAFSLVFDTKDEMIAHHGNNSPEYRRQQENNSNE